jgi:hypothetical protein
VYDQRQHGVLQVDGLGNTTEKDDCRFIRRTNKSAGDSGQTLHQYYHLVILHLQQHSIERVAQLFNCVLYKLYVYTALIGRTELSATDRFHFLNASHA